MVRHQGEEHWEFRIAEHVVRLDWRALSDVFQLLSLVSSGFHKERPLIDWNRPQMQQSQPSAIRVQNVRSQMYAVK